MEFRKREVIQFIPFSSLNASPSHILTGIFRFNFLVVIQNYFFKNGDSVYLFLFLFEVFIKF